MRNVCVKGEAWKTINSEGIIVPIACVLFAESQAATIRAAVAARPVTAAARTTTRVAAAESAGAVAAITIRVVAAAHAACADSLRSRYVPLSPKDLE